jgi:hypothetical protein
MDQSLLEEESPYTVYLARQKKPCPLAGVWLCVAADGAMFACYSSISNIACYAIPLLCLLGWLLAVSRVMIATPAPNQQQQQWQNELPGANSPTIT